MASAGLGHAGDRHLGLNLGFADQAAPRVGQEQN